MDEDDLPIIYETPRSQRFRQDAASGSLTRTWFISGTQDPSEARDLLLGANPIYFLGLSRKSIQLDPLAPDIWVGEVEYGVSAVPDGFRPDQLSFKITAASTHITQGVANQYRLSGADCAQSGNNLTADATDNTIVYPDGYTPTPGDVGKSVSVTGGGGWSVGTYAITAVVSSSAGVGWKLASAPAAASTTGGQWDRPGNSNTSGANLTCNAGTPDEVTPDGYSPSAIDVGNSVVITSGDGYTLGSYLIVGLAGGAWVLSTSPAEIVANLSGGTWHLAGTAPDCQGAIGVTLDAVQGCDILIPKVEWSLSVQRVMVDMAYIRTVRSLVGTLNDSEFYGFGPGTLLYLGCEPTSGVGTLDDGTKFIFWNLSHSFAHEQDATDVVIGGITVPFKGGFDYLWARYAPTVKAGALVQNPVGVYVDQVYPFADFTQLEIGS